jgi:thiol-disulfide isomerase/thioredoxin
MTRGAFVLLLVGAGFAGVAAYHLLGREQAAPVVATPTEATAPATTLVATVPHFELADREGKLRSLADWQGKSLIVNFWATWCAPCRREIPLLQRIGHERAAEGFQVVGIAVDFRDKVLEYAAEMKIDYPLLIGEQDALDAASAFGVEAVGFPFTVFTDRQGRVIVAHLGELHEQEAELILDAVSAVDAGTRTPAQARSEIETGLAALQQNSAEKSAG